MKRKKSNLDEMQEQELLKVEHNACWIAFWGLLGAIILQSIVYGSKDFKTLAGEWAVFIVLSVYLSISSLRRGIWDRHIVMNNKTSLMLSAVAALAMGGINALMVFRNTHNTGETASAALITAAVTFVLCFAVLKTLMKATEKRKKQLEKEPEDADQM